MRSKFFLSILAFYLVLTVMPSIPFLFPESLTLPDIDSVIADFEDVLAKDPTNNVSVARVRRDYGPGGYGGNNYGCSCPPCDLTKPLLFFSLGALLGLFVALLPMLLIPHHIVNGTRTLNDDTSILTQLLSINPVGRSMADVYEVGNQQPECVQLWLCDIAKRWISKGNYKSQALSLASRSSKWIVKKYKPQIQVLRNISRYMDDAFDCQTLSSQCNTALNDVMLRSVTNEAQLAEEKGAT